MQKNMETNTCDVNHLDADALLPPRKRLLAGLKRQNSDANSPPPPPSNPGSAGSEKDVYANSPLRFQLSNPNISNEEIVEASRVAAIEAAKTAKAARANAEEKAAKAAKAVAAAKSALDLVATLSDEVAIKEKYLRKNKMKKHVPVETLYNKNKRKTNSRTDEEVARNLHRAINSSTRILKNASGSDMKSHKHKRVKISALSGRTSTSIGVPLGETDQPSADSGNGVVGEVDTEGSIKKIDMIMVDLNTSKPHDQLKLDLPESNEALDSFGKKRGRIKQKKLPLSICSFRDQTGPKEVLKPQGISLLEGNGVRTAMGNNKPVFQMGSSGSSLMPVERTSMWKCQSFKAAACVKQNKLMQS